MTKSPESLVAPGRELIADLVDRLINARVRYDIGEFGELFADDVSITIIGDPLSIYPFPNHRVGKAAVLDLIAGLASVFDYLDCEILDVMIDGERAVVLRRVHIVHRGSNRSGRVHLTDWIRFRDGKVVDVVQLNENAALANVLGG